MSIRNPFVSNGSLQEKIEYLERKDLENTQLLSQDLIHSYGNNTFIRIVGNSRFWEKSDGNEESILEQYTEDFITGLYGAKTPFIFIITGSKDRIQLFLGVPNNASLLLKKQLISSFPDIKIEEVYISHVSQYLSELNLSGFMTGIPTSKCTLKGKESTKQIDRFIHGLFQEKWAYVVAAEPIAIDFINNTFEGIAEEIRLTKNAYLLKGTVDEENYLAQSYVDLLEAGCIKYKDGKGLGMWRIKQQFIAAEESILNIGLSLLKSIYSGDDSKPQPVRIHRTQETANHLNHHDDTNITVLNSKDLSILLRFPKEEVAGYSIYDYARFDVSLPENIINCPVTIGTIIDRGKSTGVWYDIELNDFVKHGLISGVTGSGKTNTCLFLLNQLWKRYQIPFLVIEPAKSEYRDLVGVEGFEDLQIFTLGDETTAPFRLNPFETEHDFLVQSHIDFLISLFKAVFILYAPMPYILEQSIYEIYQDKGWNLAKNINPRGSGPDAYPTLTDLYLKISEVTERAGWENKIKMDVQASLKTRIMSLRVGSKGLMLDTNRSIQVEHLLKKPTILELQQIGDDEVKAFLMGIILTKIYEFYRTQSRKGIFSQKLQHLSLIEEAHRLLKNVSTDKTSEETANIKGAAVETFCNMLSEVRAYGEGILIAEQIPTKISPDVIKNTNLKIVHRMVDEEERKIMGHAMNMSEEQSKYISTLESGQASVYAEKADKPYLIEIPNFKGNVIKKGYSDQEIAQKNIDRFDKKNSEGFVPFIGCSSCRTKDFCANLQDKAKEIIDNKEFYKAFNKLFMSTYINFKFLTQGYYEILHEIGRFISPKNQDEEDNMVYCVMIHALGKSLEQRGRLYSWFYKDMNNLQQIFKDITWNLIFKSQKTQNKNSALEKLSEDLIRQFQDTYKKMLKSFRGPYPVCSSCKDVCFYRYDVSLLLSDRVTEESFNSIFIESKSSWEESLEKAGNYCLIAAKKIVVSGEEDILKRIGLCYAAQKSVFHNFNIADQKRLANYVLTANTKGVIL